MIRLTQRDGLAWAELHLSLGHPQSELLPSYPVPLPPMGSPLRLLLQCPPCFRGLGPENILPSLVSCFWGAVTLSFPGYTLALVPVGLETHEVAWAGADLLRPWPPSPAHLRPHLCPGAPGTLGLSQFPFPADKPQPLSAAPQRAKQEVARHLEAALPSLAPGLGGDPAQPWASAPPVPRRGYEPVPTMAKYVKILYDFTARNASELSVLRDEVLEVSGGQEQAAQETGRGAVGGCVTLAAPLSPGSSLGP